MTNLQENNLKEQEIEKIEISLYDFLRLLEVYLILDNITTFDIELDVESSRMHKFPVKHNFHLDFNTPRRKETVKSILTLLNSLDIISGKLTVKPVKDLVFELKDRRGTTMISVTTLNTILKILFKKISDILYFNNGPQYNFVMGSITFTIQEMVKQTNHSFTFSRYFENNPFEIFEEHLNENEKESKNQDQTDIFSICNLLENHKNISSITIILTTLNGSEEFKIDNFTLHRRRHPL